MNSFQSIRPFFGIERQFHRRIFCGVKELLTANGLAKFCSKEMPRALRIRKRQVTHCALKVTPATALHP